MSTDVPPQFSFPVRVYYEDTDLAGIVYYANYLRFYERARTEWLRAVGVDQGGLHSEKGLVFAVRRVEVDYLLPAKFDDALTVTAEVDAVGGASLTMRQAILRGSESLSRAIVRIACVDAAGRPARLPAELKTALGK
ncbi:MAG: tol-pal system-associated acyl-CoA thioesterase [Pseudomonadota bacterium]